MVLVARLAAMKSHREPRLVLADHLRELADWRRKVSERHADLDSREAAGVLDRTAQVIESLPDDDPSLAATVTAGWFQGDRFKPSEQAAEHLRGWGRRATSRGHVTAEDLLFDLHCFAAREEFWKPMANRLRGQATKKGLRLVAQSTKKTRDLQWNSYSLETQMGISRGGGSLRVIERILGGR